jgi:acyl carrier protein
MVPAHVVVLRTLPLTANGKLDRKALPRPDVNQLRRMYLAPQTDRERQIAAIWSQVLEIERIGLDDDFFELGGHSLLATRVISRINAQLGIDIPLRSLFEAPVLREFCRTLDSAGASLSDAGLSDIEQLMDEMVES